MRAAKAIATLTVLAACAGGDLVTTSTTGTSTSTSIEFPTPAASPVIDGPALIGVVPDLGLPREAVLTTLLRADQALIAVASSGGRSVVYRSADRGVTWEAIGPISRRDEFVSDVTRNEDGFVAVGGSVNPVDGEPTDPIIWHSSDLRSWELVDTDHLDTASKPDALTGITTTPDGGFLAVGARAAAGAGDVAQDEDPLVWRSPDGRNWEEVDTVGLRDPDNSEVLEGVDVGTAGFIGVGHGDGSQTRTGRVWRSLDGRTWAAVEVAEDISYNDLLLDVVATSLGYLAVGTRFTTGPSDQEPLVWRSEEGREWNFVQVFRLDSEGDDILETIAADDLGFLVGATVGARHALYSIEFDFGGSES